ncbi:glycosyltransferase [Acidiphilium sp. AL]|uniref:glycosyltransferase n=1 Tax=Acidiphilium sp. AL TaxID=2871704 RepID=UPI0021CB537F|nr:glycosyltransferase [Acidiphilium sp. AL]MCU4161012.1 glycosyltransferase [Acidiphilium sp. AL]
MSISVHLDRADRAGPTQVTETGRSQVERAPSAPLRVLMATRYGRLGASSRLRLLQYAPRLAEFGIACTARPFLSDGYIRALYEGGSRVKPVLAAYGRAAGLRAAIRNHDLVWIEKELLPFLPAVLERALLGEKNFILDFDDAWFLRYGGGGNRLVRTLLGGKFPALLRRASLTIVANETLRDWAIGAGARNVLLLPTVVDLDHYPIAGEPGGPFTVGWIGTPVTAPYLASIAGPLRTLAAEAPLELLVIGAPGFAIDGVTCRHMPWSEATEAHLIGQCHVGIMPLPDDAWARGKSGYKLVQYMAACRAPIGSPIGANRAIVQDGVTGFLAGDAAAWCDRLRRLRDDVPLRRAMGVAARERAAEHYALQATAPRLAAAIRAIVTS